MHRLFKSRLWRALDFLGTMFLLNMFWLVGCVPVVTAGASTAALCHAYIRILQNREESTWRLYWDGFRSNFRQATAAWLVYLVFLLDAGVVLWTRRTQEAFPAWAETKPFQAAAAIVAAVVVFTAVYIFGIMAYYDCTTRQCFINALGLSFGHPLWTLLLAGMTALAGAVVYLAPFMAMLAPSACCAAQCRILLRIFRAQDQALRPGEGEPPSGRMDDEGEMR